jgi:pyruvate,water dikinase
MGETHLNVSAEDTMDKIKESWLSFFSDRAIKYMCDTKTIVEPSILIQEMVENVEKAGVIFTRDHNGDLIIEAVLGLGEGLVSGRVEPDNIKVRIRSEGNNITYRRAIGNIKKLVKSNSGGLEIAKLTPEERINRVLDSNMIGRLTSIALKLEQESGYPVDIEYAIDTSGKIYLLQRRAVTTFSQGNNAFKLQSAGKNLSLVYKNSSDISESDIIMNITNPEEKNSSIEVYFEKSDSERLILYVDEKFRSLGKETLLSLIEKRLRDKKVRERLPFSITSDAFTIDPLYDAEVKSEIDFSGDTVEPKAIKELLSAA